MSRTINFVQDRAKRAKVQNTQDLALFRKVAIGAGVIVIIAVVCVAVNGALALRLSAKEKQFTATTSELTAYQGGELLFNRFMDKVTALTTAYLDRREKQEALTFFRTLFEDGVTISGLAYADVDRALTFSLEADSVFTLENVIRRLDSPEITKKYPNVSKESLRRDSSGAYTIQINVAL